MYYYSALLLFILMFLTVAAPVEAQVTQIDSGTLDNNKANGNPKWKRIVFSPEITGNQRVSVDWDSDAEIRFSLFRILDDAPPNDKSLITTQINNAEGRAEWEGVLNKSEQYYLAIWSVAGVANYTATIGQETVEPVPPVAGEVGQGKIDSSKDTGPRWTRVFFNSLSTSNHTVTVAWNSNADVRFRVFEADGARSISAIVEGSNPGSWTGTLEANKQYYVALWSKSGAASYTVSVDNDQPADSCGIPLPTEAPDPTEQTMVNAQVLNYGVADSNRTLGARHSVQDFVPEETGQVTVELQWKGSREMNLSIFNSNTNTRMAIAGESCASGNTKTKSITLLLDSNEQYHATAWIEEGTADWVMRKIQTVGNPDFGISDFPDASARPNIVLINTDDQREKTLDFLPAIQEHLVRRGVTYTNTIVPTPSCCPSRATTLSGKYVHNNGQFQQQRPNEQIFEKTFQKYLKQAGYFTGHAGKYLHWIDKNDPIPPYWDRWTYITGGFYDVDMNFDGRYIKPGGYTTDIVFERTKDYLREFENKDDSRPWFVYLAPTSPHAPYTAEYDFREADVPPLPLDSLALFETDISDKPKFFRFRYMGIDEARDVHQQRARNLLSLDREIDQFIDFLEASGELENTLIIFTSDNGFLLGEHQSKEKFTPYRDSVEVPMVIRWPGKVPQNEVSESFVSHVDIAPTILDAAGIDTNRFTMDGYNLFDENRDTFYMEYFLDREANGGRVGDWASLRNAEYQYTEWYDLDGTGDVIFREYYDMVNDPFQLNNLLGNDNPDDDPDVTRLSSQLRNARSCSGASCP